MSLNTNWIYVVDTAKGRLAMITARDRAELPAGKVAEANPVYHMVGGFMLGDGESADGNTYRARITFAKGNHFRNMASWKGPLVFGDGRWTLREGVSISLDHYISGRKLLSGEVSATCAAYRGGKAEVVMAAGGKETVLLTIDRAGEVRAKVPEALMPTPCPSITIRALAGCDLDLEEYGFTGEITGLPVPAEAGRTEYRRCSENEV